MYTLVILLALTGYIAAAPADDLTSIVNQSQKNPNPDGFKSNHETGNDTKIENKDHTENAGIKKEAQTTKGEDYYDFSDYYNDPYNITFLMTKDIIDWRGYFRG